MSGVDFALEAEVRVGLDASRRAHRRHAANINDVENVITVFKDGVGYDSAKLIQSVKGRFGEY
jgi:hypothetical protein